MRDLGRRVEAPGQLWKLGVVLLSLLTAACSTSPDAHPFDTTLSNELATLGFDSQSILVPFELSDEMIQWAQEAVPQAVPKDQKVDRLLEALVSLEGLNLEYKADYTGTAREVFEQRKANCLSFTHLFVAMARALQMEAYFLMVDEVQTFAREGDLVIRAGHITAAAGPSHEPKILEFSELPGADYRRVSRISDRRAVALFYSNRGAEKLRAEEIGEAIWWLERAAAIDPLVADTWVNLGVARRWQGEMELSEASYRRALEIDVDTVAAYHNLAALYRHQGEEDAVRQLLALADRRGNRNPFTYLELGDLSLRKGDLQSAERFYRRALNLDSDIAPIHAALGQVALSNGNTRGARRWLKHARRLDPEDRRTLRLDHQLNARQAER
ncbi:MAG: tetratricopeptide repeat protein [Deltaproteobacteria bacterium]|nr:tetratricopeptide repeat protein [Deltaproteobacteria bacterium]